MLRLIDSTEVWHGEQHRPLGGTIAFVAGELSDADGAVLAVATATARIIARAQCRHDRTSRDRQRACTAVRGVVASQQAGRNEALETVTEYVGRDAFLGPGLQFPENGAGSVTADHEETR